MKRRQEYERPPLPDGVCDQAGRLAGDWRSWALANDWTLLEVLMAANDRRRAGREADEIERGVLNRIEAPPAARRGATAHRADTGRLADGRRTG